MTASYYLPTDDAGKADFLDHLAATLPKYAGLLEISDADIATLQADAASFRYTLHTLNDMQAYAQHWTTYKNLLRDGGNGSAEWPVPPSLDQPIPPAVAPGIIPRTTALVARIKTLKNYTPAIGQDLRVIGTSHTVDPSSWKPLLSVQIKAAHSVVSERKAKPVLLIVGRPQRRQRFCLSHHQHRAEHHRPHPATRPRHQRGMELQGHLSLPR